MSVPFTFIARPRFPSIPDGDKDLVDQSNGLKLRLYQWPEFRFSAVVEPTHGDQSRTWSRLAYFEFPLKVSERQATGELIASIISAFVHVPFERDYPGRTDELLDIVLPLSLELYAEILCGPVVCLPVKDTLRSTLRTGKSHYASRQEVAERFG